MKKVEKYDAVLKNIEVNDYDGDYRIAIASYADKYGIPEDMVDDLINYQEYLDNYEYLTETVRKDYEKQK